MPQFLSPSRHLVKMVYLVCHMLLHHLIYEGVDKCLEKRIYVRNRYMCAHYLLYYWPLLFLKHLLKKNSSTEVFFMGPLIPMFWTFDDVCPGFQSQGGSLVYPHTCRHINKHLWMFIAQNHDHLCDEHSVVYNLASPAWLCF